MTIRVSPASAWGGQSKRLRNSYAVVSPSCLKTSHSDGRVQSQFTSSQKPSKTRLR